MVKFNLLVLLGTNDRLRRLVSRRRFLLRERKELEARDVSRDIEREKIELSKLFSTEYERICRDMLRTFERYWVDWEVISAIKREWIRLSPEERRARAFAFRGVDLAALREPLPGRELEDFLGRVTSAAYRMVRPREDEAIKVVFHRVWDEAVYDPAGAGSPSPELTTEEVEELKRLYRKRREVGLEEEEYTRMRELELKGARGPRIYIPKLPRG